MAVVERRGRAAALLPGARKDHHHERLATVLVHQAGELVGRPGVGGVWALAASDPSADELMLLVAQQALACSAALSVGSTAMGPGEDDDDDDADDE